MKHNNMKPLKADIAIDYLMDTFSAEEIKIISEELKASGMSVCFVPHSPKHIAGLEDLSPPNSGVYFISGCTSSLHGIGYQRNIRWNKSYL